MKDLVKEFAINAVATVGILAGIAAFSAAKDWHENRKFRKELDKTQFKRSK